MNTSINCDVQVTLLPSQKFGDKYIIWFKGEALTLDTNRFVFRIPKTNNLLYLYKFLNENLNLNQLETVEMR